MRREILATAAAVAVMMTTPALIHSAAAADMDKAIVGTTNDRPSSKVSPAATETKGVGAGMGVTDPNNTPVDRLENGGKDLNMTETPDSPKSSVSPDATKTELDATAAAQDADAVNRGSGQQVQEAKDNFITNTTSDRPSSKVSPDATTTQ